MALICRNAYNCKMKLIALLLLLLTLTTQQQYNSPLAYRLTYLSAIAYEPQALIESWTCELCGKVVKVVNAKVVTNDTNSVYGYVGYSPDLAAIVIAFRGSVDTANWILNLKTTRTDYPLCSGCSVHVGFNQGFNSVKTQVNAIIDDLIAMYRGSKILLTGHSLGGALAVMAAAHIQNVYGNVGALYTMGQPRVGNDVFAQFMTSFIPNTFRVVNYADQVPHVPQSILGFKHSGTEIWYQRGMSQYVSCPSESKDCSNQLTILTLTQADHKMVLYLTISENSKPYSPFQEMLFRLRKRLHLNQIYDLDLEAQLREDRMVREANQLLVKQ